MGIVGVGSSLPEKVWSTDDVAARVAEASGVNVPQRMLRSVTQIETRRVAADDEYASTLAVGAARVALGRAGLAPGDVDLLLFASASRDVIEPATAHIVQRELGSTAHALDVSNACNSFINGIDVAHAAIATGRARRALVVTGETPTRAMRWEVSHAGQLVTHFAGYTFGDAGAAVVLSEVATGGLGLPRIVTDSSRWDVGGIFGGGSRDPRSIDGTYFTGNGHELREVFEKIGPETVLQLLADNGVGWGDLARVFVHQVTVPYTRRFCELTGCPPEKLVWTVPELGNVASATLGIQLDRVWEDLVPGDRCLFVGLGGGVSVMSMLWER